MSTATAGTALPNPSFAQLGLPEPLVAVLRRRGITQPLPIQAATIAEALGGRDVSGKAPTGSGKTLAFALPMAATVARGTPKRPRGLVLAPTRELAAQITKELAPLLATRNRRVHPIYGGVGFGPQRNALRRGVDVAVACPGRLEDLMGSGDVLLSEVDMVVVDEADRMADMGFLPAVRRILEATAAERQTLLFSATLDGDVDVLVRRFQRQPVRHEVAPEPEAVGRMTHRFETVEHGERPSLCARLVSAEGPTVVFVRTKHGADRLARQLRRAEVAADAIHGGRSQSQRQRALAAFKAGRVQALVATDVAARGIHVDGVSCVIHYDLPADPKDYVHRSGRTARAGAAGSVVAMVTPDQAATAGALRRALGLDGPTGGHQEARGDERRATAGAHRGAGPRRRRRPPTAGRRAGAGARPSASASATRSAGSPRTRRPRRGRPG